ncbi:MAG: bifunctional glutamate--cysteine ligase GshA/glutathione synthetase GshB [Clostridium baratii]|uniref:Glutathione biosynthesis bifunctional protein GshAB n=1 Tax=Clostridium baratii str. Sullivan TaxID=1415775 RepID=A0A0A7FV06_9CLOT|nr:bifunctional glutamate--cysteine ligase GshA/glutathione synthetase GshB [Clostridium baratii]AIY83469.1 glutamate--cysteine ligase/gamma-glutamylcysteine synthetase [Clostridium baratii str. Sullivan]MBS6006227.1 bifunctional glutamate--cysteine ligase GshA/glutathione synthetase GshB [Clostridium baratii]MDU1053303.1 bifunctional glutamate--cysteine ligase GshA/glutathione synthetase GshB [Clostridium baratii]CUP09122.1 bifunctional glutamate--cysteine ligase/glutathione synthetase [Clostr
MYKKLLDLILENNLERKLIKSNFGLEKENLRVDSNGKLALTKHPEIFKEDNPYIKRDFSESQVEMVTPACKSIDEVYDFMENLHNIVTTSLKDEYLWPQSNPPIIPKDDEIPVAKLHKEEEVAYREGLVKKYGAKRQLVSGVHYNFSFDEDLLKELYSLLKPNIDFKNFKDDIYFKIGRNLLKYKWLLIYLTGASPVFHKSYKGACKKAVKKIGRDDYYFKGVNSLRNSECGYKNLEDFYVSYNNVNEYVNDIRNLINDKCIQGAREYYSPIRFKTKEQGDMLNNLLEDGVKYIEIRLLDLDPLCPIGVSKDTLNLIFIFVLFTLFTEDFKYTPAFHDEYVLNENRAIENKEFNLINIDGKEVGLRKKGLEVLEEMEALANKLFKDNEDIQRAINISKKRFEDYKETIASNILEGIRESDYIDYFMDLAKEYLKYSEKNVFKLKGYEDLELSTQILILDSMKHGIEYEMLDRRDNFISLKKGDHIEYVKQATKTSKDAYITALIMENKLVTKKVLEKNNIKVPKGGYYENIEDALGDYYKYKGNQIVVKPKSTNFGIGITIFKGDFTKEEYNRAVEIGFENDNEILIEEFIKGKEYRFLVINDEVCGILHRVPANVVGDGKSTIRELVEEKNKNPLRGKGYKTPLEKISLGEAEEMFLRESNKDFDYVPSEDETVYLRENSNISTGGDSIDFTDDIDDSYKEIAIKAARSVNAKITGVDMMINDIKEKANSNNYGIIEINFNPAIHIHSYPYKGLNRKVAEKVLKLLFGDI